jgi:hypothetical protein
VLPQQREPVLDAGQAVRDLGEVAVAEALLLVRERAVVGRDRLQVVVDQRVPDVLLVPLLAQRRRADEARALEVRALQVLDGGEQVLDAGLGIGRDAARAGRDDLVGGALAGHVDDVDRRARVLGQPDRTPRRLGLELLGPRQRVVDRVGVALRQRLLDQVVDAVAVLGVHHDQAAGLLGAVERRQEEVVGDHQRAAVREEHLEGRDALVDHRLHVGERAVVGLRDRHVEAVVDVRGTLGAPLPLLQRGAQAARVHLQREVDEARDAAGRRRLRAGVVVVVRPGAAERHRQVRVVVDQARQHVAARRVDRLGVDAVERADGRDRFPVDQHVRLDRVRRRDDRAPADDLLHR